MKARFSTRHARTAALLRRLTRPIGRPSVAVDAQESPDDAFRRTLIVRSGVVFAGLTAAGTLFRYVVSPVPPRFLLLNIAVAVVLLASPLLARRGVPARILAMMIMLGMAAVILQAGMYNGGIAAPVCALIPLIPMMGMCFGGRRLGVFGLAVVAVLIAWLVEADRLGYVLPLFDPASLSMQRAIVLLMVVASAYAIGAVYEASRRRSEQRLVEASRLVSLGTMAGGIAHEINNPLAIIVGNAHKLAKLAKTQDLDRGELASLAARMVATSMRMAKIVAALRAYARDEAAEDPAPVRLVECVDDACTFVAERFKGAGVDLRIKAISPELEIRARRSQVTQVVLNLLSNAFDAVEPLPEKWVEIACAADDAAVTLSVSDAGRGIPKEVSRAMFVPFFTTKDVGRGVGLGLSVCAGIMAQHGGEIAVDDAAPHTRFLLRFPRLNGRSGSARRLSSSS